MSVPHKLPHTWVYYPATKQLKDTANGDAIHRTVVATGPGDKIKAPSRILQHYDEADVDNIIADIQAELDNQAAVAAKYQAVIDGQAARATELNHMKDFWNEQKTEFP